MVVATVNVPPPPVPCITLTASAVDFGTLSFRDPAGVNVFGQATPSVHMTSCSTAPQLVSVSATDATTSSGAKWTVTRAGVTGNNMCLLGPNVYRAGIISGPASVFFDQSPVPWVTFSASLDMTFTTLMPCRGSAGAGETASFTYSLMAAVVE